MTFEIPRYTLNDGQSVPVIGFGTYPLRGDDGVEAMVHALEAGYRLLDTAVNYGNEEEVGEAVRRSGLPREDIQVTSKIPGRHHEYDQAIGSVEESLRRLRFDYLDRVLIHWPNPGVGKYVSFFDTEDDRRNSRVVIDACVPVRRKKTFPKIARSSKALDDRMRAKWAKDLPKGF